MCVVSMISEHYIDKWNPIPNVQQPSLLQQLQGISTNSESKITDAEIKEFRDLLKKAREYDKRTNQPHCEDAEKIAILKELARVLGINISFVDGE